MRESFTIYPIHLNNPVNTMPNLGNAISVLQPKNALRTTLDTYHHNGFWGAIQDRLDDGSLHLPDDCYFVLEEKVGHLAPNTHRGIIITVTNGKIEAGINGRGASSEPAVTQRITTWPPKQVS